MKRNKQYNAAVWVTEYLKLCIIDCMFHSYKIFEVGISIGAPLRLVVAWALGRRKEAGHGRYRGALHLLYPHCLLNSLHLNIERERIYFFWYCSLEHLQSVN